MDENRILDRLRRGDPAALEKLMDRYLPYVSAVVWNILRGGAAWTDGSGVTYTLDAALLSPLSLSFHYVSDLPMPAPPRSPEEAAAITPADLPRPNAFALVLRDGTRIDCGECETGSGCAGFSVNTLDWKPCWSLWDCVIFDAPIDPSQIDHVEYGENVLRLQNE